MDFLPLLYLILLTVISWLFVFFLYNQKNRFTLVPIYSFIAVSTFLTHNLTDLGYQLVFGQWHFLIGSITFFTTLMLSVLTLYLFEGPRATRIALWVVLGTSFFYIILTYLLGQIVDTSSWVQLTIRGLEVYFWSVFTIILDIFFIAISWELTSKIKSFPILPRVFIVVFGTYLLDSLIFTTAVFRDSSIYFSILTGGLIVRLILAVLITLVFSIFLKQEGFKGRKKKPKNIFEILNFQSDLESKIESMENVIENEKKMREELFKFQQAVEAASDQIVITDKDGSVLYANPVIKKLTGFSRKEALGKKAGKLWGGLMPSSYYQEMWQKIKEEKTIFVGELVNKHKNGSKYEASVKISPILNSKNEVSSFVAIERDISKEKQLERMKDDFLSMASHEIRTPLTAIDGLVAMIRDGEYGKVNPELKQPLADINASSERLICLVNDLLSVSRMQTGKLKYSISDFDVKTVIDEVANLLKIVANQKKVDLICKNISSVNVRADLDKVKQILTNLVGNAIKFTDQGSVYISMQVKADYVGISVKDTGIGIKQVDREKIFQRFEQLDSGKGRPAGTGLGLFISKELAVKMGGDLVLSNSSPGKGSEFTLTLLSSNSNLAKNSKFLQQIDNY